MILYKYNIILYHLDWYIQYVDKCCRDAVAVIVTSQGLNIEWLVLINAALFPIVMHSSLRAFLSYQRCKSWDI